MRKEVIMAGFTKEQAAEALKALRSICAKQPDGYRGCKRCPMHDWCGTVAPSGITDEDIEELADLAVKEAEWSS